MKWRTLSVQRFLSYKQKNLTTINNKIGYNYKPKYPSYKCKSSSKLLRRQLFSRSMESINWRKHKKKFHKVKKLFIFLSIFEATYLAIFPSQGSQQKHIVSFRFKLIRLIKKEWVSSPHPTLLLCKDKGIFIKPKNKNYLNLI